MNLGINEYFWPETVKPLAYLANKTKITTYQSVPFKIFLHV